MTTARALTLTSDGRWFGWHWELDAEVGEGAGWITSSITGWTFTRWGARRLASRIARRERRRRTERTTL